MGLFVLACNILLAEQNDCKIKSTVYLKTEIKKTWVKFDYVVKSFLRPSSDKQSESRLVPVLTE